LSLSGPDTGGSDHETVILASQRRVRRGDWWLTTLEGDTDVQHPPHHRERSDTIQQQIGGLRFVNPLCELAQIFLAPTKVVLQLYRNLTIYCGCAHESRME
jgi:hypothetical protein